MKLRNLSLAVATVCASLAGASVHAAPSFYITDLGTLGSDNFSIAYDINNSGQIVGFSTTNTDVVGNPQFSATTAFLWTPTTTNGNVGSLASLGTGLATSINSVGQVVGQSSANAVLWGSGSSTPVTLSIPGTSSAIATAINDSGTVTINTETAVAGGNFISGASVWTPTSSNATTGTSRSLGDLGPAAPTSATNNKAFAFDINNNGVISGASVGTAVGLNPDQHAILWQPGTTCGNGQAAPCSDVGDLAGGVVDAQLSAINDAGAAVGVGTNATGLFAIISQNGAAPTVLGAGRLGTDATIEVADINESGEVVGSGEFKPDIDGGALPTAWYFSAADGILDLNTLIAVDDPLFGAFFLAAALGINDSGDIVGYGVVERNGIRERRAFLLTELAPAPVPVPAAVWLLGSALVGLGVKRRRRV